MKFTPRDIKVIRYLRRKGYGYPVRTRLAQKRAKISLATALALLTKETGGGRNVFGCDYGPGVAFCHERVTKDKVASLRRSGLRNGIGPVQLTADAWVTSFPSTWEKVHRPYISMYAGFLGFRKMVELHGLFDAARRYNGAVEYAKDFIKVRERIVDDLRKAGLFDDLRKAVR